MCDLKRRLTGAALVEPDLLWTLDCPRFGVILDMFIVYLRYVYVYCVRLSELTSRVVLFELDKEDLHTRARATHHHVLLRLILWFVAGSLDYSQSSSTILWLRLLVDR